MLVEENALLIKDSAIYKPEEVGQDAGERTCLSFLTNSGIRLNLTEDQGILVLREGVVQLVKAVDIVVGEKLVYTNGTLTDKPLRNMETIDTTVLDKRNKPFTSPAVLCGKLAWLMGLYQGDGSTHRAGIRIAGNVNDIESLERANKFLKELFDIDGTIYSRSVKSGKQANNADLYASSRHLLRWLRLNNLTKNKTRFIEMPIHLREAGKSVLKEFIDGYAHADGCFKSRHLSFCTTSHAWSMQLLVALRATGTDGKVSLMPPTASSLGTNMRYWIATRGGRDVERRYILRTTRKDYEDLDANGMPTSFCDEVVEADNSTGRFYEVEGVDYLFNYPMI